MAVHDLISENDAAALAGVSAKTLTRFAEAGYLQVEGETEENRRYSLHEIKDTFGVMDQTFYDKLSVDLKAFSGSTLTATNLTHKIEKSDYSASAEQDEDHSPIAVASSSAAEARRVEQVSQEVKQLRTVIALQEKLLDARDGQLEDLKHERDWLKTRIEKLEQKAERDQLLLLSESQTVRKLVALQGQKKSAMRSALEWFGFVAPQQALPPATKNGNSQQS
ncbi:MAG: hypothetical protein K1X83_13325 [Oligoflexia bacterium]|nr:hypothetical protein [Oligoflexia bacterium]